nr:calcineurin-like phosphoesterase [Oceanusvirus sp.]
MHSYTKSVPDYEIKAARRIVVVPDVHRDLEKAKLCLRAAGVIDGRGEWKGEKTVVVQVGDQVDGGDRGPQVASRKHRCGEATKEDLSVLRFFNRLHLAARKAGGAVLSLAGNHELMNVHGDFSYSGTDGCETCERARATMFRPGGAAAKLLATSRVIVLKVGRIVFCHAGLLPWHARAMHPERLNKVFTEHLVGNQVSRPDIDLFDRVTMQSDGALFNRSYTPSRHVSASEMDAVLREVDADHMIIGHNAHAPGVTPLHGGRVWVVDPGMSSAVMSGRAAVLEIMTLTPRERRDHPRQPAPRHSFRVVYA